jgi:hypothetical protein
MATVEQARAAKQRYAASLLDVPGVCGVGVERRDHDWTLVLHVDPTNVDPSTLPVKLGGVSVQVHSDGPFRAGPARCWL